MAIVKNDNYPAARTGYKYLNANDDEYGKVLKANEQCKLCDGKLEYPFIHYNGFGENQVYICHECCELIATRGFQADIAKVMEILEKRRTRSKGK